MEKGIIKLTLLAALFGTTIGSYAQSGTLDNTFGTNGTYLFQQTGDNIPYCVAVQPDDKILVSGYTSTFGFSTVLRLKSDGSSVDSSFGNGVGYKSYGSGYGGLSPTLEVRDIKVLPNGKILLGGRVNSSSSGSPDFAVARLNDDGSFDNTFGINGIASYNILVNGYKFFDVAEKIAVDKNGNIYAAGNAKSSPYEYGHIVKFDSTGKVDSSFGTNGSYFGGNTISYYALAIDTAGNVIVGGKKYNGIDPIISEHVYQNHIVALDPTGNYLSTFGTGQMNFSIIPVHGQKTTYYSTENFIKDICVDTNTNKISFIGQTWFIDTTNIDPITFYRKTSYGRILPSAQFDSTIQTTITQYTTSGNITFVRYGYNYITAIDKHQSPQSLLVLRDGRYILGGGKVKISSDSSECVIYSRMPDAEIDTNFNGNGRFFFRNDPGNTSQDNYQWIRDMALQKDGKIIAVSPAEGKNGNIDYMIMRINNIDTIPSNGGSGNSVSTTPVQVSKLYPNPFSDKLHLETTGLNEADISISLYDITGRLISIEKKSFDKRIELSIPTSIQTGMYILQTRTENSSQTFKIFKQ